MSEVNDIEPVTVTEGQVTVDIERDDDSPIIKSRKAAAVRMFSAVTLPVKNANDVTVAEVRLAECKLCYALVRRDVGRLVGHLKTHQRRR